MSSPFAIEKLAFFCLFFIENKSDLDFFWNI